MNLRKFVLKAIQDTVGARPSYSIREDALGWFSKGVLTEDDLDLIDGMLPAYGTTLEEAKATRQHLNKQALAQWLADHPLTWTDGSQYGVTLEDQTEMALNYTQYQAAFTAGQPATLEWHTIKKGCHEFSPQDFLSLSLAVSAYVYPYLRHQEQIKEQIYAAATIEAVKAVAIDYSTVAAQESFNA